MRSSNGSVNSNASIVIVFFNISKTDETLGLDVLDLGKELYNMSLLYLLMYISLSLTCYNYIGDRTFDRPPESSIWILNSAISEFTQLQTLPVIDQLVTLPRLVSKNLRLVLLFIFTHRN